MIPLSKTINVPAFVGRPGSDTWEVDRRREQAVEVLRRIPEAAKLVTRNAHPTLEDACAEWQWGDGSMLLLGPTGSGKSAAAVRLIRRLLRDGVRTGKHWHECLSIRWAKASDIATAARESKLGSKPELLDVCETVRFLVLDDLGLDKSTDTSLNDTIKARYDRGLPTIITSHLSFQELCQRYGAASRWLVEGGDVPGRIVTVKL